MTGQSVAGMQVSLRESLRLRLPALIALVTTVGLIGVVGEHIRLTTKLSAESPRVLPIDRSSSR